MKEFICVIDTDFKLAEMISAATADFCKDFNHAFVHYTALTELDAHLAAPENKDCTLTLLILSSDILKEVSAPSLQSVKSQYKTNLVLTTFEDPLKPLKKTETWPVDNIIYKPFDPSILKEHLRCALIKDEKIKMTSVHSSAEANKIEKIRRQMFIQLSEFGFKIETSSNYNLDQAYKFYHLNFVDKKKSSLWAKAISMVKADSTNTYEFIFCAPSTVITTSLRQKANETKTKLKTPPWLGYEKNKSLVKPNIFIQMNESEDFERLKDFFARKYPEALVTQLTGDMGKEKLICDLLISENEYTAELLKGLFHAVPLYFRISNDVFRTREETEEVLKNETLRIPKPVDRNYLSRMIASYFPGCVDADPLPVGWFLSADPALFSEAIVAHELSEVAFTYQRPTQLKRGDFQEFALTQDDETELKPIKAKIQFVDPKPDAEQTYLHQVVFFGIRDDLLKKIRLWMLQNHINHKKSES